MKHDVSFLLMCTKGGTRETFTGITLSINKIMPQRYFRKKGPYKSFPIWLYHQAGGNSSLLYTPISLNLYLPTHQGRTYFSPTTHGRDNSPPYTLTSMLIHTSSSHPSSRPLFIHGRKHTSTAAQLSLRPM